MTSQSLSPVDENSAPRAVKLLHDFFKESGFPGDRAGISSHLRAMLEDAHHWAALIWEDGQAIGVVTVTTMLYVEWGRLGEIGDLYVMPAARRRGLARRLVGAAFDWCRAHGCSAVSVVVTERGETQDGLGAFYRGLGFAASGRRIYTRRVAP
jgi:aminoglycoside 6'-N-acetyltransferase I